MFSIFQTYVLFFCGYIGILIIRMIYFRLFCMIYICKIFTLPSSNKISFRLGHNCKYIQFSNIVKESCKLYNVLVTCRFLFRFFLTFLVSLTFLFYSKLMLFASTKNLDCCRRRLRHCRNGSVIVIIIFPCDDLKKKNWIVVKFDHLLLCQI